MSALLPASSKDSGPWLTLRTRVISLRVNRRVPLVALVTLLATLAVMIVNIGVGEYPIAPLDVVKTALRIGDTNKDYDFIVNTLRLPRMLVAVGVGVALGVSGAIMQGLTRNPLASPDILGISAGAGLTAVALIVIVKNVPAGVIPFAAFAGAGLVALLIYLLAWRKGDSPIRMVLIGIGLGAIAGAGTSFMITFGNAYDVQRALVWLTGSVYARSWEELHALLPWLIVFVPAAVLMARHLNVLNLGEEVAMSLGSKVSAQRGLLILVSVALAGASVAAAGTIGFIGLMAPHIARKLVGVQHEGLLPISGVIGGFILVAADLVGRTIFAPIELPAGLVVAVIGAPFFVYLLILNNRR
ncbi:MAG: FecCD family ABC transporter permease [Candidatus Brachytrichaceae bacterium NZ_4S206]|jgi:iron complex transport system permease protein